MSNLPLLGWVLLVALLSFAAGVVCMVKIYGKMVNTQKYWHGFFQTLPKPMKDVILHELLESEGMNLPPQ